MVGLLLLKQTYALSDEQVCERWVYDPYFQYFTGTEFFATSSRTPARAFRHQPLACVFRGIVSTDFTAS